MLGYIITIIIGMMMAVPIGIAFWYLGEDAENRANMRSKLYSIEDRLERRLSR